MRSVRVDGDGVVVVFHGYRVAAATVVLMLCALLSAAWLLSIWFRMGLRVKRDLRQLQRS